MNKNSYIQIKEGTELLIENNIYICKGFWCLGNEITSYIFCSPKGTIFTREYEYIQELLNNKTIIKL